jgi:hypothetical protein
MHRSTSRPFYLLVKCAENACSWVTYGQPKNGAHCIFVKSGDSISIVEVVVAQNIRDEVTRHATR